MVIATDIKTTSVNAQTIQQYKISLPGEFAKAIHFNDAAGEHLLLLTKRSAYSKTKPNRQRIERHELKATSFRKMPKGWVQDWVIFDFVDCPGLDSEANFFLDKVSITDVNGDGYAETSVPYNLFCGGGVDPKVIKIIMRTKNDKFAVRGQSKVIFPGQEPFGGELEIDPA